MVRRGRLPRTGILPGNKADGETRTPASDGTLPGNKPEGAPYLARFWLDVGDADLNQNFLAEFKKTY
jgi:hypothetical protein